jgi:hypothetical protein
MIHTKGGSIKKHGTLIPFAKFAAEADETQPHHGMQHGLEKEVNKG